MPARPQRLGVGTTLKRQALVLVALAALFWGVELVNAVLLGRSLDEYGIRPRTAEGLRGIVFAPFLHGSLGHVAANTLPFLALGWLVMVRGLRDFLVVSGAAALLGGLGVWLIGNPDTRHVGASGMVLAYLGFLLMRGYFERSLLAVCISILVGLVYGGLAWGILPLSHGESWEGHLLGFLTGALCARLLSHRPTPEGLPART